MRQGLSNEIMLPIWQDVVWPPDIQPDSGIVETAVRL